MKLLRCESCCELCEQAILNRGGYAPEISHGVLVEMAEHRKDLEKKTKPILDTLRSYQDLPPVMFYLSLWSTNNAESYKDGELYKLCIGVCAG